MILTTPCWKQCGLNVFAILFLISFVPVSLNAKEIIDNIKKFGITVLPNEHNPIRINVKPLSVNECWRGRRWKTKKYEMYSLAVSSKLPKLSLPEPPYKIYLRFGFSSTLSDFDNPIKPTLDILAAKYKFNDKLIRRAIIETEIVSKGREYFEFQITSL